MLEVSNFILSGMKLTAQNHHCFQNAICTSFCCEAAVSNLIFSLLKNWELFMVFLWQAGGKKERDRCITLNLNSVKFQRLTKFWWHIQKSLWLSWLFILGLSTRTPQGSGAETTPVLFPLHSYAQVRLMAFLDARTKADVNFMEVPIPMIRFPLLPSGYWAYFTNFFSMSEVDFRQLLQFFSTENDNWEASPWWVTLPNTAITTKTFHNIQQNETLLWRVNFHE